MKKNHLLKNLLLINFSFLFLCCCKNQLSPKSLFSEKEGEQEQYSDFSGAKKSRVSIACWNVQTFFDAVSDGNEYTDFKNSSKWTKEKYVKRLSKLCEVMTMLNSDIIVLEEIENEAVVQDIVNRFTEGVWDHKKSWQYACFSKEKDSAIGCAVFSRFELSNLTVHSLDVRVHKEKQPSSRPLMQVTAHIGQKELTLFVNHWKSKSGGEEETEIWRDWQESVLAQRVHSMSIEGFEKNPIVMCGDFNRSVEDFTLQNGSKAKEGIKVVLRGTDGVLVQSVSPWLRKNGSFTTEIGSYFFDGKWERIDNFFFLGDIVVNSFGPVTEPPLADEKSIPQGYNIYTDSGCSDHLPLKCEIII